MSKCTLICDASFDPETKAAGWGCWMKADGKGSSTRGGPLLTAVVSSFEAETLAIGNALHVAIKADYVAAETRLMIQSDCVWALAAILKAVPRSTENRHPDGAPILAHRKAKYRPEIQAAISAMAKLAADLRLSVEVRHVRGHKDGGGRQWVNRTCDALAKDGMRQQRRAFASATNAGAPP